MTFVTTLDTRLPARGCSAYAGGCMPRTMIWLAAVIRVAIAPVLFGALVLLPNSPWSASDLAVSAGLVLLGAIHVLYWWRPSPSRAHRAAVALPGMVFINFVL